MFAPADNTEFEREKNNPTPLFPLFIIPVGKSHSCRQRAWDTDSDEKWMMMSAHGFPPWTPAGIPSLEPRESPTCRCLLPKDWTTLQAPGNRMRAWQSSHWGRCWAWVLRGWMLRLSQEWSKSAVVRRQILIQSEDITFYLGSNFLSKVDNQLADVGWCI